MLGLARACLAFFILGSSDACRALMESAMRFGFGIHGQHLHLYNLSYFRRFIGIFDKASG